MVDSNLDRLSHTAREKNNQNLTSWLPEFPKKQNPEMHGDGSLRPMVIRVHYVNRLFISAAGNVTGPIRNHHLLEYKPEINVMCMSAFDAWVEIIMSLVLGVS